MPPLTRRTRSPSETFAVSLNRVGDVQVRSGQVRDAVESYGRSLKIREKFAADSPDNLQARRDLLLSHVSLGMAHQALAEDGRAAKAERLSACRAACDSYQRALETLGRLRVDGALQPSEAGMSDVLAAFRRKCLGTEANLSGSGAPKQ